MKSNVVIAKLARMRKAREWTVMPTSHDCIIVQTEAAIAPVSRVKEKPASLRDAGLNVVEMRRLELLTPYMQKKNGPGSRRGVY